MTKYTEVPEVVKLPTPRLRSVRIEECIEECIKKPTRSVHKQLKECTKSCETACG